MKPSHLGIAFVLRSGKAALCFILAHIHDNHALGFETWNKCELTPIIKYIAIDVLLKVIRRKQHFFIEHTNRPLAKVAEYFTITHTFTTG